jgi:hypothetical protein
VRLLTKQQLEELTGYRQKAAQVRWLQQNGIRHYIRADGHPNVPESAVDAPESKRAGPNLDAVRRTG